MAAVATIIVKKTEGVRRFSYPVGTHLTFPPGRVHQSARFALQASIGELSPVQTRAVELWNGGSVRCLRMHFPMSMRPPEQRLLRVDIGAGSEQSNDVGNTMTRGADEHGFTAAVHKFSVTGDRRSSGLFRSVLGNGKEFMLEGSQGLGIVTSQGELAGQ